MKINKLIGRFDNKGRAGERGQALVLVLIFMLLASLIIPPLLNYMTTGVKTGQVFENKTDELLAADAGISDGMYQVKYDYMLAKFPDYYPYDYAKAWSYQLSDAAHTGKVNGFDVDIDIENIWIPCDRYGIPLVPPTKTQAKYIVEGLPAVPPNPKVDPKLIVAGSLNPSPPVGVKLFDIKLIYNYASPENLKITSLGVWLPYGFHFKASSIYNNLTTTYCSAPVVTPYNGGEAVVWTFNNYPFKGSASPVKPAFPGYSASGSTQTSTVTFEYTVDAGQPADAVPAAVAWIVNSDIDLTQQGLGYNCAWDADMRIYHVASAAGDAEVEAYTAQNKPRELEGTIPGDYKAVGNSLMTAATGNPPIRYTLLGSSQYTVLGIPNDAVVKQARLYWSGWVNHGPDIFTDTCQNMDNWGTPGNVWKPKSRTLVGALQPGPLPTDEQRTLTAHTNKIPPLHTYAGQEVTLSWKQWGANLDNPYDGLDFAISKDDGAHWGPYIQAFRGNPAEDTYTYTIPDDYLTDQFLIRFYLVGCTSSNESVTLDDIKISSQGAIADNTVTFQVNGHSQQVTTHDTSVLENEPGTYSYACFLDVTDLVRLYSTIGTGTEGTGNGTYVVGGVNATPGNEWSYAGWSLIVIYTSADTYGNQLYIYDDFLYATMNSTKTFSMSGFLVPEPVAGEGPDAAKLTCFVGEGDEYYSGDRLHFVGQSGSAAYLNDSTTGGTTNVWNSKSAGMSGSVSGVDIDTFSVPWGTPNPSTSGLLRPDDTKATIELPTQTDSWNLIYIIVAFRSKTDTGGVLSYLILE
jgi:hypothetical protein